MGGVTLSLLKDTGFRPIRGETAKVGSGGRKKPCYNQLISSSTSGSGRLCAPKNETRMKYIPCRNVKGFKKGLKLRHLGRSLVTVEVDKGVFALAGAPKQSGALMSRTVFQQSR